MVVMTLRGGREGHGKERALSLGEEEACRGDWTRTERVWGPSSERYTEGEPPQKKTPPFPHSLYSVSNDDGEVVCHSPPFSSFPRGGSRHSRASMEEPRGAEALFRKDGVPLRQASPVCLRGFPQSSSLLDCYPSEGSRSRWRPISAVLTRQSGLS